MEYYTVKEAANYLGVNPETIRRWVREGLLETVEPPMRGRKTKFTIDALRKCCKRTHHVVNEEFNTNADKTDLLLDKIEEIDKQIEALMLTRKMLMKALRD